MSTISIFSRSLRQISKAQCLTSNIVRSMAGSGALRPRDACLREDEPKCSEKNLEKSCKEQKKKPKSMWANPECCLDPCKDYLPRFDDLYYKPSNKAKRKYTRTWSECPPIKILPKKICCFDRIELPPIERRTKPECPLTACPVEDFNRGCKALTNKKCIKVKIPGCCPARDPPKCRLRDRGPSGCKKICTPYPSFSECSRQKPKPLRPIECKCLYVGPICSTH